MDYLPLFFDLKKQNCLLVGGGKIALRKARLLCKAGAIVKVVAPQVIDELKNLVEKHGGELHLTTYTASFLQDVVLVISATDNESVNQQVAADCRAKQIPVNVVDSPALCTVIMPAIVDRSPLVVGISSGGESPVLARAVRSQLESALPAAYGNIAKFASRYRDAAKQTFKDEEQRRRFWEQVIHGPIAEQIMQGDEAAAEAAIKPLLEDGHAFEKGEVYLVGAGPGDPDLLTFKALRLMQKAEVVLYDRLVSPAILDMVRRDADRIYVGKQRSDHAVPQGEINQMLVDFAKEGKRVLRLKGGDPFIFGRGGEEIELLAKNNVPFQVVPGITAASGCASYAGIPLTHRDHAQSVRFVTGHLKDDSHDHNWQDYISDSQTLVVYMGLKGIAGISAALIKHGKLADTPVALIEKGTTPDQKVHISTLGELADYVAKTEIHAPTLLIIGGVVALHHKLRWFDPQNS